MPNSSAASLRLLLFFASAALINCFSCSSMERLSSLISSVSVMPLSSEREKIAVAIALSRDCADDGLNCLGRHLCLAEQILHSGTIADRYIVDADRDAMSLFPIFDLRTVGCYHFDVYRSLLTDVAAEMPMCRVRLLAVHRMFMTKKRQGVG